MPRKEASGLLSSLGLNLAGKKCGKKEQVQDLDEMGGPGLFLTHLASLEEWQVETAVGVTAFVTMIMVAMFKSWNDFKKEDSSSKRRKSSLLLDDVDTTYDS